MNASPVTVPLINPNEPEALLAAVHIQEGQQINSGDLLFTLETTKSAQDVYSDTDGFIVGLTCEAGQTFHAGDLLFYVAPFKDWLPNNIPGSDQKTVANEVPSNLRITRPALNLAQSLNLKLDNLPQNELITEDRLHEWLGENRDLTSGMSETNTPVFDASSIIVYGGGGHGKSVLDLLKSMGTYYIVGIIDDKLRPGSNLLGIPVVGDRTKLPELHQQGIRQAVNAVGGIGNVTTRIEVFNQLHSAGFTCPAIVHPKAYIEPSARLEAGTQVFPFAYVGSDAVIGYGSIVNTGAIVSHDCQLSAYVNLSPGATLAGGVEVGEKALVGMSATINLLTKIGAGARIGNGATVKSDVPPGGLVPAGGIWPRS